MFSEEPELQFCPQCGIEKDVFEFRERASGSEPICFSCTATNLKEWNKEHPDVLRNRQARRRTHIGMGEEVDRFVVFNRDQGICQICGLKVDPDNWHLDHKIPVTHGGSHVYDNVGVAHSDCNIRKGNRLY